jgi:hypothetical protein
MLERARGIRQKNLQDLDTVQLKDEFKGLRADIGSLKRFSTALILGS